MSDTKTSREVNPKLEAVVRIRQLATGLRNDWASMTTAADEVGQLLSAAKKIVEESEPDTDTMAQYENETRTLNEDVQRLKSLLQSVSGKLKSREASGVADTWNQYHDSSDSIERHFASLEELGLNSIDKGKEAWGEQWSEIREKHHAIGSIAAASGIHLMMIEQLAPDEVDKLTDSILKAIPHSYSVEDAKQYEAEFIQAWEDIKRETHQNNLWDKFLTILAGGAIQSPAQRVMMQRWLEGERGDL